MLYDATMIEQRKDAIHRESSCTYTTRLSRHVVTICQNRQTHSNGGASGNFHSSNPSDEKVLISSRNHRVSGETLFHRRVRISDLRHGKETKRNYEKQRWKD